MTKMWKTLLIIPFIIWVSLVSVYGLAEKEDTGRSFLWEIEGAAGKSYLLGSVHLLKKEHYPLKPAIEKGFEQTDALAVEINLGGENMMKQAMALMQKGMFTGEETLKNNISEETYQLAKKRMEAAGMNIETCNKFKPWFLAMTITSSELVKLGFSPNYGIDIYFLGKASGKKEIAELEGIDFQLKMLDGLSKAESESFLLSSIKEADLMAKEFDNLIDAWITGNIEKMERLLTENEQKTTGLNDLYKKILDDRNEKMVEKIVNYLKSDKTYFIVAGAAHMVGKKGIVRLLEKRGIKTKQL